MRRLRAAVIVALVVIVGACTVGGPTPPKPRPRTLGDPTIAAAGDIACNSGQQTSYCRYVATSDLVNGKGYAGVLTLGDNQYESNVLSDYQKYFGTSWGRFKSIIHPGIGNHEYLTSGASGYFNYFGAAAGSPSKGYYAFNIGTWRIYAINSNCSKVGGCARGSPQETWLRNDLAANPKSCVLAYWHHPRFSSGQHGNFVGMTDIWSTLYAAKADVVLNGHDHDYERFASQTPSGALDTARGIRQFVVGTGGKNHYVIGSPKPNSQVRNDNTFGVLSLTLHSGSYDWRFVPEAGKTFTDSGSSACVGGSAPAPSPSPSVSKSPSPTPTGTIQPTFPIRAAFYYPWFPEAWTQSGHYPYTNYHPSLGFYDGRSIDVVRKQITAMQYGKIGAGIASWWGTGLKEDLRFPTLLQAAGTTGFKWAIYYEPESQGDPSVDRIRADLTHIRNDFASNANYLKVDGKFVVFVYAAANDGTSPACGVADRWKAANTVGAYVVLKVFSGYRNCASQPQSWHQYSPAVARDQQAGYSYAISPGFWQWGYPVRLARDLARFKADVCAMTASREKWQLVTTFNEWGEGTSVESANEWASASNEGNFLDALRAC